MDLRARLADHGGKRSEEHTSELQSQSNLVCRLLLEKKLDLLRAQGGPRALHDVFGHAQPRRDIEPGGLARQSDLELISLFFLMIGEPPGSTLFPLPTRSR